VTIDANCTFGAAISIAAERVTVRGVRVIGGLLSSEEAGIAVANASGVRLVRNRAAGFFTAGIWLTAITASLVEGNQISGHAADVRDDGATNCRRRNSFTTGTPPVGPC
jgi:nitrous oxidase accessory protein NosD